MKILKYLVAMFLVAVVAAIMFNVESFGNKQYNKEVGFCANCHEMRPNYFTWMVTSHNQFGCLKCHKDIKITTFAYKHWRTAFATPVQKKNIIPNSVCESCHASTRSVTPPGDLIFPHQLHVIKQIDCVDCHDNVTHLGVADHLKNTKNVDLAAFNDTSAKKLIKKQNQILMPVCMRCHNGDMASSSCQACHKNSKSNGKIAVN